MTEIFRHLEKSRDEFVDAARSVPRELAHVPPEPGRWSALLCVEHVTTVEERFLKRLASGEAPEVPPADAAKEMRLLGQVRDRSTKIVAPEVVRPTGRFTSLDEALEHYNAARDRSIAFAKEQGADLYKLGVTHPRFGALNGAELMTLLAGHSQRHAEQIREVGESLARAAST